MGGDSQPLLVAFGVVGLLGAAVLSGEEWRRTFVMVDAIHTVARYDHAAAAP